MILKLFYQQRFLALGLLFVFTGNTQAQKSIYGNDSLGCLGSLSLMNELSGMNNFDEAYQPWNYCFINCPASSRNIYINGARILKYRIEKSTAGKSRENLIDTLMLLYDRRIKYFGQEGYVLGRKGMDLLRYRPAQLIEACSYFEKSANLEKEKSEAVVLINLLQTTVALNKMGVKSGDDIVNTYQLVSDYLAAGTNVGQDTRKSAVAAMDKIFLESGFCTCEAIDKLYKSKIQSDTNNIDLLNRVIYLFSQKECTKSALFIQVSGELFRLAPTANAATNLASLFAANGEYSKATDCLSKAVNIETDHNRKADIYLQMSFYAMQGGNYPDVKSFAMKALDINANSGQAYLLIGIAYASAASSCGSNTFESAAVYWAAVDKFNKAKAVDTSYSGKANELISKYSAYFPDNEDAFFHGYADGQQYTVGCWINEKTIVRTRKIK